MAAYARMAMRVDARAMAARQNVYANMGQRSSNRYDWNEFV